MFLVSISEDWRRCLQQAGDPSLQAQTEQQPLEGTEKVGTGGNEEQEQFLLVLLVSFLHQTHRLSREDSVTHQETVKSISPQLRSTGVSRPSVGSAGSTSGGLPLGRIKDRRSTMMVQRSPDADSSPPRGHLSSSGTFTNCCPPGGLEAHQQTFLQSLRSGFCAALGSSLLPEAGTAGGGGCWCSSAHCQHSGGGATASRGKTQQHRLISCTAPQAPPGGAIAPQQHLINTLQPENATRRPESSGVKTNPDLRQGREDSPIRRNRLSSRVHPNMLLASALNYNYKLSMRQFEEHLGFNLFANQHGNFFALS